MRPRCLSLAAFTTAAALCAAGPASAAPARVVDRGEMATMSPAPTGPAVAYISAFPTGGKGSGTEATCGLWTEQLQDDERAQDAATDKDEVIATTQQLDQDVSDALDAGCAVIYSARLHGPGLRYTNRALGRMATAMRMSGTGTSAPAPTTGTAVAYISAFPAGGKGSGTEATCKLWTTRLQDDQAIIDNAPDTDKQDAAGPLNEDVDNALDAGCAVIF